VSDVSPAGPLVAATDGPGTRKQKRRRPHRSEALTVETLLPHASMLAVELHRCHYPCTTDIGVCRMSAVRSSIGTMRKPRIHEIAAELALPAKRVLEALRSMGEHPKGPSSSIQPPVARRVKELLLSQPSELHAVPIAQSTDAARTLTPRPAPPRTGLQFGVCSVCTESHALQRNGAMSIHSSANGERCTGGFRPDPEQARSENRPASVRRIPAPKKRAVTVRDLDPELQAAFDAAKKRRGLIMPKVPERVDRRIYAVKGFRTVSGGLPGTGKKH